MTNKLINSIKRFVSATDYVKDKWFKYLDKKTVEYTETYIVKNNRDPRKSELLQFRKSLAMNLVLVFYLLITIAVFLIWYSVRG